MQRDTTPLARALVALTGLALCAIAGVASLDATVGLGDPRSADAGGDTAPIVAADEWCVLPAVAGEPAFVAAQPVPPVASLHPDQEPPQGSERVAEAQRAPIGGARALLVAHGAAGLLPEEFVAGFDAVRAGAQTRRVECSERQVLGTMVGAGAECAVLAGELTPNQVRAGLRQQTLGAELFALQVACSTEVRTLDAQQVRRIFRGEVRDWQELGFGPGPIVPIVPADAAVAERAARALLGGGRFAACCVPDGGALPAGGVRLLRLADAAPSNALRLLRVGDVVATSHAFFRGIYPFGLPLQLVTPGAPALRARQLLAFARSDEGRALLGGALAFAD